MIRPISKLIINIKNNNKTPRRQRSESRRPLFLSHEHHLPVRLTCTSTDGTLSPCHLCVCSRLRRESSCSEPVQVAGEVQGRGGGGALSTVTTIEETLAAADRHNTHIQTVRQAYRQTQTDRQTDRPTDRHTITNRHRNTDRHKTLIHMHAYIHTYIHTYRQT